MVGRWFKAAFTILNFSINFFGLLLAGELVSYNALINPFVLTKTGHIALTRIFLNPNSLDNDWVNPLTPNFEAEYAELFLLPL